MPLQTAATHAGAHLYPTGTEQVEAVGQAERAAGEDLVGPAQQDLQRRGGEVPQQGRAGDVGREKRGPQPIRRPPHARGALSADDLPGAAQGRARRQRARLVQVVPQGLGHGLARDLDPVDEGDRLLAGVVRVVHHREARAARRVLAEGPAVVGEHVGLLLDPLADLRRRPSP